MPSIEQTLSLRSIGSVTSGFEGSYIAHNVQTTDWNENRSDNEIWISKNGDTPFQFTNTAKGSSTSPAFSPNKAQWLAFLADRGNKTQIYVIRVQGGEARQVTNEEEGISSFEWHPSGKSFVFRKSEKEDKSKKETEKRYGGFSVDDQEFRLNHLWQVDFSADAINPSELPCYETVDSLKVKAGCIEFPRGKRLTEGKFTVGSYLYFTG
ncbi:MAG: hypothetical protein HC811_03555 [Flammeovirgaceae bacterium]|nr:hypothetical protein [Flammeovirgaceae bacterium]